MSAPGSNIRRRQQHLATEAGTATGISISWGQSWFAARHCGLYRKVSGSWRSTPPTGSAPVKVWVARVWAWLGPRCPAPPPLARLRPCRAAQAQPWPVASAQPAPPPQTYAANSEPAHPNSDAGRCAAVVPGLQCALSGPAARGVARRPWCHACPSQACCAVWRSACQLLLGYACCAGRATVQPHEPQ